MNRCASVWIASLLRQQVWHIFDTNTYKTWQLLGGDSHGEVSGGKKMALRETDLELYIIEYA